jgi:pilus assembly protein CpaC
MFHSRTQRLATVYLCCAALAIQCRLAAAADNIVSPPITRKIDNITDRLEMVINTSRLLTLDLKIPRAQVNNKDVVDLQALSPNTIQISAKKAGVTQVNLWDEKGQIHAIDVLVFADPRPLTMLLQSQFPHATIKVTPSNSGVILSGLVTDPDDAAQIIKIAEDYYPKVISRIRVAGVQQILLHVKVLEVSRTKLREMGFDFWTSNQSFFLASTPSGLLNSTSAAGTSAGGLWAAPATSAAGDTFRFGVVSDNFAFFGFLDALRQYQMAKVMAEPTLVTVSGRPAFFNSGGEFPILIPSGLGTTSVDFKKFGTQVDFVPVVLDNGNIRLEVKPRISFLDNTLSVTTQGITIPGLNVREVDTGVEMKAGQTFAIAGLVQNRTEYSNTGIPYLADLPYFGAAFRKVKEDMNEIELIIMVTPELVEPMNPADVPPCGPGMTSRSPNDCELYWKGYSEVPAGGPCGASDCLWGNEGTSGGIPMPGNEWGPKPAAQPGQPAPAGGAPTAAPGTTQATGPRSSATAGNGPLDPSQPAPSAQSVRYSRGNPQDPRIASRPGPIPPEPDLIGPTGYDVVK